MADPAQCLTKTEQTDATERLSRMLRQWTIDRRRPLIGCVSYQRLSNATFNRRRKLSRGHFLAAITNDLTAVVKFHDGGIGGFHSVPREVFCYIDYISAIRYGANSSANAIQFIEKYLGTANPRYKHYGKLLYEMWRHGTVHEFDPKRLKHSNGKYSVGWQTNNDSGKEERACHLECFEVYGKSDTFVLNVNLFQLVDDFVRGVHEFISELKKAKKDS